MKACSSSQSNDVLQHESSRDDFLPGYSHVHTYDAWNYDDVDDEVGVYSACDAWKEGHEEEESMDDGSSDDDEEDSFGRDSCSTDEGEEEEEEEEDTGLHMEQSMGHKEREGQHKVRQDEDKQKSDETEDSDAFHMRKPDSRPNL